MSALTIIPYEADVTPAVLECESIPKLSKKAHCILNRGFNTCTHPAISEFQNSYHQKPLYSDSEGALRHFFETPRASVQKLVGYFNPQDRDAFFECLARRNSSEKLTTENEIRTSREAESFGFGSRPMPEGLQAGLKTALKVVDYASLALICIPGGLVAFAGKKIAPALTLKVAEWLSKYWATRVAATIATQNYAKAAAVIGSQGLHLIAGEDSILSPDPKFLHDWFGEGRAAYTIPAAAILFVSIGVLSHHYKVPTELALNTLFASAAGLHQMERIQNTDRLDSSNPGERKQAQENLQEQAAGALLFGAISGMAKAAEAVAGMAWMGTALCAIDDVLPALISKVKNSREQN